MFWFDCRLSFKVGCSMEVVDFLDGKGNPTMGKGTVSQAVENKAWYKLGVLYVVNDKLQILLSVKNRKNGGDGLWQTTSCEIGTGLSAEVALTNKFKQDFGVQISPSRLQHLLKEKYKIKLENKLHRQFVDMYIVKKNVDINAIKCDAKTKWVQLKTYISHLENKDENYKKYSKNNAKILKTYLNFKQFIKNI